MAVATDTLVDWTVQIFTDISLHWVIPSQDLGPKLLVLSLDGNTQECQLEAVGPPQEVSLIKEKTWTTGRLDTYTMQLPDGFQPAAVSVLHP